MPSLLAISVARALPEPPSIIEIGRSDCELLVTGRSPGEEPLPTHGNIRGPDYYH